MPESILGFLSENVLLVGIVVVGIVALIGLLLWAGIKAAGTKSTFDDTVVQSVIDAVRWLGSMLAFWVPKNHGSCDRNHTPPSHKDKP